ncbi:MAG: pyruvate:ferredoxin (flavodoxin) oxidoreductase [Chitinivibrionia bacterium]|nr:pyruvate:ferredoxin (flavodoxin) oxidoreductase [Chitinivibrionia bacterium]
MGTRKKAPHDGNSAVAHVAHATNEVIAIYPITPSSPMGEISDEKSARGEKNIWGTVPSVSELQSEAGAAGAIHGSLATGAMSTTFTASQGLLLMIPNMYKIAGELIPTVFHVSARALAAQGLNIFGDHSDVMACRQTGWVMLSSSSVQEAMDFALISQAATLESRIPFLHFFDGFRVSHEVSKIEELTFDDMRAMVDNDLVRAHRERGLSPDRPMISGTSQNPDVYFTGRETVNKYYDALPAIVQKQMDKFAKLTGRQYNLFDYVGAKDAEKVIIIMGSGCETVHEVVDNLTAKGEKVGVLKVRLFLPFETKAFINALPTTVKKLAVMDRTKEPGSIGEPLYQAVLTALAEAKVDGISKIDPVVVGGRYGLGSCEFIPGMIKAIYDNLNAAKPKNHFTVGICDDVCGTSLEYDAHFTTEGDDTYRAIFYGLGSDGTVGANKNTIKIISDETDNFTQAYFVYDSKKAGTLTSSHLRFGPKQIRAPYLITKAKFIACHNFSFLPKYDMLRNAEEGAAFLLTSEYSADEVWQHIPGRVQKQIVDKKLKFYVIDAIKIAEDLGLGARINSVMQSAFFKITNGQIMDEALAVKAMKDAIQKTYGNKGDKVVKMNHDAVDAGLQKIQEVKYSGVSNEVNPITSVPADAPKFVKDVTQKLLCQEGHTVKVSEMPADGRWITGTTKYEKRNIAVKIPVWNTETCIQCNNCVFVCPHGCLRAKVYDAACLSGAPATFKSADVKAAKAIGDGFEGKKYTLQVGAEDCTGCGLCIEACPAKEKGAIKMEHQSPLREQEVVNYNFFLDKLPDVDPTTVKLNTVKGSQFVTPLFEYSGACAGCGETGFMKLLSQLFGDRLIMGNATGCSSIYGGNLPTTPYTKRKDGRGPVWSNSLFEDTAEFAYGMRMTADKFMERAQEMSNDIIANGSADAELKSLLKEIVSATQITQNEIEAVRTNVEKAKKIVAAKGCCGDAECAKEFLSIADYLVKKSVWAIGGDGWAYDIGFGGLDHVIATGKNVNLLVMDTEVYSNTGGQASKATPKGAVAKFAAGGKPVGKKDLGAIAYSYGYVYVARVSLADPAQVVKAMLEAEAYDGPSVVIAYSHCVAHGITMSNGIEQAKKALATGHIVHYRYNPALALEGKNPLTIDSKEPTMPLGEFTITENRFRILKKANEKAYNELIESADKENKARFKTLKHLASE